MSLLTTINKRAYVYERTIYFGMWISTSFRHKLFIMIEIGKQYGDFTILGGIKTLNKKKVIKCKCVCGKIRNVIIANIEQGRCLRCRCEGLEKAHKSNRIRGISKGCFHYKRKGIRDRCRKTYHHAFNHYGERGIECQRKDFRHFYDEMYESFLEHSAIYGEKDTTIERIDVNGHYSKSNCRWASRKEQNRNKRDTLWVEHEGKTKSLGQWAYELGFNYGNVKNHIVRNKMSLQKAIDYVEENRVLRESCSSHSEFVYRINERKKTTC